MFTEQYAKSVGASKCQVTHARYTASKQGWCIKHRLHLFFNAGKNHVDRAKEAEEAFKARRAAALAKSRAAR